MLPVLLATVSLTVLDTPTPPPILPKEDAAKISPSLAQVPETLPGTPPDLPPETPPPDLEPLPPLPPPDELLPLPTAPEALPPGFEVPGTIVVREFEVLGSTVFSATELATVTAPYTNTPITFAELLEARAAVTQLYLDAGYITTGAFIPTDQVIDDGGVVNIQVVEGFLETVVVEGNEELVPGYLSSRIERAAGDPLNVNRLLEGLQVLQLDPLVETITAELSTGTQVGGGVVTVSVEEADSFDILLAVDNGRSPTVGSFRRQAGFRDLNLSGLGDTLAFTYSNTEGSNTFDIAYTVPVSPANTTVGISYSHTNSEVIDDDFEILSIESESNNVQFTLRHPLIQTPTEELALSLELSHSHTESTFQLPDEPRLGFPFAGAPDGEATVTAIRLGQEWTQRTADRVFAVRSQFSVGTDWFGATQNEGDSPDSNFFSWQGQAQWLQVLAPDTLLLARVDGQLANRPLLSLEQFRLGGLGSVRGYPQNRILADSGVFASLEARVPVMRIPEWDSLVQVTPFFDWGHAWNNGDRADPDPATLISIGAGVLWQVSDRMTARLDYGIPLINDDNSGNSLQESGILFSITGRLF
ncbi:MAG: ShlB/FhaC/HecB family hemolysin secretion/activation protein [Cyanobacteria bacterium P01_F01_bin.86]